MRKLKFNKEKLSFDVEKKSIFVFFNTILKLLFVSLGLALLYYVIFATFFNNNYEKKMLRETRLIEQEYDEMLGKLNQIEDVISNLQERDNNIYYDLFNAVPYSFFDPLDSISYIGADLLSLSKIISVSALRLSKIDNEAASVRGHFSTIDSLVSNYKKKDLSKIPSIAPLRGFSVLHAGATIGDRIHPFYKTIQNHTGFDIVSAIGVDVVATADGIVDYLKKEQKGRGKEISIKHNKVYTTNYCNLADILVRKGQRVKKGQVIGRVGNSGTSFAPHLHYEVLRNGEFMNPIDYFFSDLTPHEYLELLGVALNTGQSLD